MTQPKSDKDGFIAMNVVTDWDVFRNKRRNQDREAFASLFLFLKFILKSWNIFVDKRIDRRYTRNISYKQGSEHMKKAKTETRTRRHIYIEDDLYKQASIEAARKDIDKGKVIDEALKKYFGGDERQG